jgi:hypothetical protein
VSGSDKNQLLVRFRASQIVEVQCVARRLTCGLHVSRRAFPSDLAKCEQAARLPAWVRVSANTYER